RLANAMGGEVASEIYSINSAVIYIHASDLDTLVADDAVMWVEPPLPQMSHLNAENRALTGVNMVQAAPYNLDGTGVDVLIYDGGRMVSHNDFASRLTIGSSDTAPTSDHATHVGGTVGGDGTANINNRGMAPGVQIISYGFEQEGGLQQGFLYTDPGDLEADYSEAIALYGADISNNSIGTNTAPNGYPCDWTGNYGVTGALIDAVARGSLGNPFRIVWANGNERQTTRCLGDDNGNFGEFYSTAPPAGAKNHITVGSVDADTDLTSSFSSWGPLDDGRIKPDISAPGCQAGGDGGVTSTSSFGASSYSVKCGTSMASPTVTGISALILEQYRITNPEKPDLMNATLKSLLANTAVDRGNVGPDYKYGYGSVRADAAIDAVISENVIEGEVAQGGTYQFIVIIGPGDNGLQVTMAWDDVPGTPNVDPVLINDLDLRVVDSNGTIYMPWTLNPANPDGPATQGSRDGINNIEQVTIPGAAEGAYTVQITGFNVAVGATQTFGATSNGFLVNCSSAGLVSLAGGVVPCSGSSAVQVIDCDLNTSDTVIDTVDVLIASDTNPSGFMLTLTETDPASAAFAGSFSYSDSGAADIMVNEGDSITATYIDLDDGNGGTNVPVVASVTVDCTPPMLLSAGASNIGPRAATIDVEFDEPASATVFYGTSMGSLNDSVSVSSRSTMHAISLSGLTDNTSYVFAVEMTDGAGNMSYDDNSGAGYAFTTPDIPDFFTEEFASFDLVGKRILFTPNGTFEGYDACLTDLDGGMLPFDPTAGTAVSLSDDDSELVNITGGESVELFGVSYTSFYIGSNGYLTFTGSDTDYSETLEDHFDTPRVSGRFDDLNPSSQGTVRYQQLADRMIVSFDNVTEYSSSNNNTFQFELFFTGEIAISWESIVGGDGIVGLSAGNGLDPDFLESDLSTYAECTDGCRADVNGDGILDIFDVFMFLDMFNRGSLMADFDGNKVLDIFDVFAFLDEFNAGCP
ncbi:MAG: S8 family serine peptidase, partial [Phycisphaerales bacterium]|nr:S8 family serine peptidase [Phycisphaerales bacterium]